MYPWVITTSMVYLSFKIQEKKKDQLVNSNLQIHGFDGFNLGKNLLSNVLETYEFIKILKKSMFSLSHFLQWNENLIDYRGGDVEEA